MSTRFDALIAIDAYIHGDDIPPIAPWCTALSVDLAALDVRNARAALENIAHEAWLAGDDDTDLLVALLLAPIPGCCGRSTPQHLGDPALGHCPVCGSTLGRWMDDGSRVPPMSMISFSVEIEGNR